MYAGIFFGGHFSAGVRTANFDGSGLTKLVDASTAQDVAVDVVLCGCGIISGLIFLPLWPRAFHREDVFVLDLVEAGGRRTNLFRGRQQEAKRDLADTLGEIGQIPVKRA